MTGRGLCSLSDSPLHLSDVSVAKERKLHQEFKVLRSYSWTKSRSSIVSGQTAIDTQRPLLKNILKIYPSDRRRKGEEVFTKWSLILDAYHTIRKTILNNHRAMSVTDIQLPLLNRKTLQQWFNEKSKDEEKKILMQGLALPTPKMTVAKAPEALPKPTSLSRPKNTPNAPIPAVAPVFPCPTPSCDPVMSFQLITTTEGIALLIPNIPHSTKQYQKRKQEL